MQPFDRGASDACKCEYFRCRYLSRRDINCLQSMCGVCRFGKWCINCVHWQSCSDADERMKRQGEERRGYEKDENNFENISFS